MKELLSDVIYKYTGIKADSKENLLDLPIIREYWLYILVELEDTYKIPVIRLWSLYNRRNFQSEN